MTVDPFRHVFRNELPQKSRNLDTLFAAAAAARAKWVRHFQIWFELKSYISEINDIDSVHAHVPNLCFENAFDIEQPNLVGLLKKVGEYHFIILGKRDKIDSQVHYT